MIDFILWYLTISILGLLSFPIAFRVLPNLTSKGYGLSRVIGLLVWGFLFWLLTSLQIAQNTLGGIIFALGLLFLFSYLVLRNNWRELFHWIKENRNVILQIELVFIISFCFWAFIRSTYPDIVGTEKPMEMAFINAISRSPIFPPNDPWLSGYSISYYYFGYVMISMLIRVTGVLPGVAFNLSSALWFALTAIAGYSLVYNLISSYGQYKNTNSTNNKQNRKFNPGIWPIFGPIFILIMGNLEGLLEMLHSKGVFWTKNLDGNWSSEFWSWLNLKELVNPPSEPLTWIPERVTGIWWWRASRILEDFTFSMDAKEIIDEFPFFSYLLADLHPHVLAMPFAILAIAIALNIYLEKDFPILAGVNFQNWFRDWKSGESVNFSDLRLVKWLKTREFWFAALATGGLGFLNTWDFPIYVGLIGMVIMLRAIQERGWNSERLMDLITMCITLGAAGVILYLPFYLGFGSQAGGFLPSLFFFTKGKQLWMMFAGMLVPAFIWLIWLNWKHSSKKQLIQGSVFSAIIVFGFWFVSYIFGWVFSVVPQWMNNLISQTGNPNLLNGKAQELINMGGLFYGMQGSSNPSEILIDSLGRRFAFPGAWITLLLMLMLVWGGIMIYNSENGFAISKESDVPKSTYTLNPIHGFVLLLLLMGLALVIVPEFIYLRDQFGWRMNTIFKFYFQAWILWGIAAATILSILRIELKTPVKQISNLIISLIFLAGCIYPIFGIRMKIQNIDWQNLSLDGTAHIQRYNADEMEAIEWLREAPIEVLAEAVGGSYSGYARISTNSGQTSVIGWPGHESQWGRDGGMLGRREQDIETLYRTSSWQEAQRVLNEYDIGYVYIGNLEESQYRLNLEKFDRNLEILFSNKNVKIYGVSDDVKEKNYIDGEQ
ncbi:MAG: hypothetical protein JEZ06_18375 [Anaerolineaceae bacterium]|nr:hypothetical protein [Anaerolineaceae bacterium]